MNFSEIIDAIESEIRVEYLPAAIAWADENREGAWSAAIDRFDVALSVAQKKEDYAMATREAVVYKRTLTECLRAFKASQKLDEVSEFLSVLRERKELDAC